MQKESDSQLKGIDNLHVQCRAALDKGNWQEAEPLVSALEVQDADSESTFFAKAKFHLLKGDREEAAEIAWHGLNKFPMNLSLAVIVSQSANTPKEFLVGEMALIRIISENPKERQAWVWLATIATRQNDWFRAARLWREVRTRFPGRDDWGCWLHQSNALLKSGQKEAAIELTRNLERIEVNEKVLLQCARIAYHFSQISEARGFLELRGTEFPDAPPSSGLEEQILIDEGNFESAAQAYLDANRPDAATQGSRPESPLPPDLHLPPPDGLGNDYTHIEIMAQRFSESGQPLKLPVSIVIPTYNRPKRLARTLAGLTHQTYPISKMEIVIADDGSREDLLEVVRRFEDRLQIKYVRQSDRGYRVTAIRNLGIRAARHEHIILLDCDVLPHPKLVEAYMVYHHVADNIALFGLRRFVNAENLSIEDIEKDWREAWALPDVKSGNEQIPDCDAEGKTVDWRAEKIEETDRLKSSARPYTMLTGGNLSLSKIAIERAGWFDEEFEEWGREDQEFGFRLYNQGFYFLPVSDAMVLHQEPPQGQNETDRSAGVEVTRELMVQKVPLEPGRISSEVYQVPMVSIYIPSYNAAPFIEKAVTSALDQSFSDLEVVICDDGSTDGTTEVLRTHFGDHPRVKWMSQANAGIGAASNKAFSACRGIYVGLLDADDELLPHAVETMVNVLDKDPDIGLAYSQCELIDKDGISYGRGCSSEYSREKLMTSSIASHFLMYRMCYWKRTEGFDESITNAVDFDMALKMAEVSTIAHVPVLNYRYRWHGKNTSLVHRRLQEDNHLLVIKRALKRLGLSDTWEAVSNNPLNRRDVSFVEIGRKTF